MDIETGLIMWAAQALTLGALLLLRGLQDRGQRFCLSWGIAFAMFGAGLLLAGLRGKVPAFLSIELANTMALAAIGLLAAGVQQFDGRRVETYIAVPALLWIGGMLLPFVREDFASRVLLYHLAACLGYAMSVVLLFSHDDRTSWARRILAGVLVVQVLTSLAAALSTVMAGAMSFADVPLPSFMLLSGAFCFLATVLSGAQMLSARTERRLQQLAMTDPLTGVLNRRGMMDQYDGIRQQNRLDKPMIALIQFDLDDFKQINDRYGHEAGDAVLRAFCRLAAISFDGRGTFGRMGGEEFASILRVADFLEAATIAEGLRMTLALQTIAAAGHPVNVTVSAGIALQSADQADLDQLLTGADRALYAAKAAGRNRTAIDQPAGAAIVPSASMLSHHEMTLEIQASKQVSTLRRIAEIANG